jgi:hypothetical protein
MRGADPLNPEPTDPTKDQSYPREELVALVNRAQRAARLRGHVQVWVLALGLALLALGLSSERLWGSMELPRMVAGEGGGLSYGLVFPIAAVLHSFGLDPEQACFLLSALAFGLCLPALVSLLAAVGFQRGVSLWAALTTLLSGLAWLGSTQPGDLAPGVLGAILLMLNLFRVEERIPGEYLWRVSLSFILAFFLRPENLLLFPSVAWALSQHRPSHRLGGPTGALVFSMLTALCLWILLNPGADGSSVQHLLDNVLAGRDGGLSEAPLWLLGGLGGLGLGCMGLYALLFGKRLPQESPPPSWVVPWCLVALAPVVAGKVEYGPAGGFLLPAAAVGLADWLSRREQSPVGLGMGSVLLLPQVLVLLGLASTFTLNDPLIEWRPAMRAELKSTDRILSADPQRRYLAEVRWNLDLIPWPVAQGVTPNEGRVVFLDRGSSKEGPWRGKPLHPSEAVTILWPGGEETLAAGQVYEPR